MLTPQPASDDKLFKPKSIHPSFLPSTFRPPSIGAIPIFTSVPQAHINPNGKKLWLNGDSFHTMSAVVSRLYLSSLFDK